MTIRTFLSRFIDFLSAELSGKNFQHELNENLVNASLRSTKISIAARIDSLSAKLGRNVTADEAIESLKKTEKGFAFEGLSVSDHLGNAPLGRGYHGVSGSEAELSPTDTAVDIKVFSRNLRTGVEISQEIQNKASISEAMDAISDPKYRGIPIVVPKDVYKELSKLNDNEVKNAISTGKLIAKAGQGDGVSSGEISSYTKAELQTLLPGRVGRRLTYYLTPLQHR